MKHAGKSVPVRARRALTLAMTFGAVCGAILAIAPFNAAAQEYPARFSTITERLAIGRNFSAKWRTSTSAPLPGGKAQMK